jgi:hypothetical protein
MLFAVCIAASKSPYAACDSAIEERARTLLLSSFILLAVSIATSKVLFAVSLSTLACDSAIEERARIL